MLATFRLRALFRKFFARQKTTIILPNLLILLCFISSTSFQKIKVRWRWSPYYQAEIVAHLLNADNHWRYTPASDSGQERLFFDLPRDNSYFEQESDSMRKVDALNLYKFLHSYFIGDDPFQWQTITLRFTNIGDTSRHLLFSWDGGGWDSLQVHDQSVEDRLNLLALILPSEHLEIMKWKGRLKKRFIGISLPLRPRWDDHDWDQFEATNYSNALGSLIYDYVLERENDRVSKVVIEYGKDYHSLDSPAFLSVFTMESSLFARIKKQNFMVNLGTGAHKFLRPYTCDVKDRLAAVSYLMQGDIRIQYTAPTSVSRGNCIFDYYASDVEIAFPKNDPLLAAQKWVSLAVAYGLGDSIAYYDSIKIRIFDSESKPLYGWSFPVPNHPISTTVDTRMQVLLNCLPFTSSANWREKLRQFNIALGDIPHFSPRDHLIRYCGILYFVANDWVFQRDGRDCQFIYTDPTHKGWNLSLALEWDLSQLAFLRMSEQDRHLSEKKELQINQNWGREGK